MKGLLRRLMEKAGYTVFKTAYVPKQVDVTLDVRRLAPDMRIECIFDVGANVGETVQWFHRAFPQARIIAFEPIKATFNQLRVNVGRLPNVTPLNVALGAETGEATVYLQARARSNSLNPAVNQPTSEGRSEVVQVETVARIARKLGIPGIDFLKIDTEGYELQVLAGAKDFLPTTTFIYAEVDFETAGRHTNFFALYEFLSACGFNFYGLYDLYHYEDGRLNFANALFVNPRTLCSNTRSP